MTRRGLKEVGDPTNELAPNAFDCAALFATSLVEPTFTTTEVWEEEGGGGNWTRAGPFTAPALNRQAGLLSDGRGMFLAAFCALHVCSRHQSWRSYRGSTLVESFIQYWLLKHAGERCRKVFVGALSWFMGSPTPPPSRPKPTHPKQNQTVFCNKIAH